MEQESLSKQVKKLKKYIYTLKAARELNKLDRLPREAILEASPYDLLDVTDVTHLSALNGYIIDQLR
jgi:hypothetical protein